MSKETKKPRCPLCGRFLAKDDTILSFPENRDPANQKDAFECKHCHQIYVEGA